MRESTPPGLAAALKALKAPKRKPNEGDQPPSKPPPRPKTRPLPGQLSLADEITAQGRKTP